MSDGWYFNGEAGTQPIPNDDSSNGWLWMDWKDMDTSLLCEMLEKLTADRAGNWGDHIEEIKEELEIKESRKPPKVIVSVTVKGKIK